MYKIISFFLLFFGPVAITAFVLVYELAYCLINKSESLNKCISSFIILFCFLKGYFSCQYGKHTEKEPQGNNSKKTNCLATIVTVKNPLYNSSKFFEYNFRNLLQNICLKKKKKYRKKIIGMLLEMIERGVTFYH